MPDCGRQCQPVLESEDHVGLCLDGSVMKFDTCLVPQGVRNLPSYQAGHIPRPSGHLVYPSQEDEHLHCCLPGTLGIFESLVWLKGG